MGRRRYKVLKKIFYWSIRKRFEENRCDYRALHPETYVIDRRDQCVEFAEALKRGASLCENKSGEAEGRFVVDEINALGLHGRIQALPGTYGS